MSKPKNKMEFQTRVQALERAITDMELIVDTKLASAAYRKTPKTSLLGKPEGAAKIDKLMKLETERGTLEQWQSYFGDSDTLKQLQDCKENIAKQKDSLISKFGSTLRAYATEHTKKPQSKTEAPEPIQSRPDHGIDLRKQRPDLFTKNKKRQ